MEAILSDFFQVLHKKDHPQESTNVQLVTLPSPLNPSLLRRLYYQWRTLGLELGFHNEPITTFARMAKAVLTYFNFRLRIDKKYIEFPCGGCHKRDV